MERMAAIPKRLDPQATDTDWELVSQWEKLQSESYAESMQRTASEPGSGLPLGSALPCMWEEVVLVAL